MNKQYYLIFCFLVADRVSSSCKKCFPPGFLWGTASSSYQVEGAWNVSGRGEHMWDWFAHTYPEKIADGSNGDLAVDFYNRYEEDVGLLADLGVGFYRFSLNWARILPNGTVNNINQEGVDFYLNLLKKLRENGIEPVVTLYHWELPMTLHELGGWTNPEIADYFNDFATLCYQLFGEYVKYWLTVNEPFIQCYHGYGTGVLAPGYTESGTLTYKCFHTQLLAHAKAYRSYNDSFKLTQKGQVGIVLATNWFEPLTNSEKDAIAAENSLQWDLGLGAHPIFLGNWPPVAIDRIDNLSASQGFNQSRLPTLSDKEVALIKGTCDYLGLNYYTTDYASAIANISAIENSTISYDIDKNVALSADESWPEAAAAWLHDVPTGLRKLLNWISKNYGGPKIMITENGWADGMDTLNDTNRITYMKGHLCNMLKARFMDGVDVFGYGYWSFTNSYEWATGYTVGFGLIDVDYSSSNLTRTPKTSYYYYQNVIKSNCLEHCAFA